MKKTLLLLACSFMLSASYQAGTYHDSGNEIIMQTDTPSVDIAFEITERLDVDVFTYEIMEPMVAVAGNEIINPFLIGDLEGFEVLTCYTSGADVCDNTINQEATLNYELENDNVLLWIHTEGMSIISTVFSTNNGYTRSEGLPLKYSYLKS